MQPPEIMRRVATGTFAYHLAQTASFVSYNKWVHKEKMSIYDPLTLMLL